MAQKTRRVSGSAFMRELRQACHPMLSFSQCTSIPIKQSSLKLPDNLLIHGLRRAQRNERGRIRARAIDCGFKIATYHEQRARPGLLRCSPLDVLF